jgi:hypothetical protein
MWVHLKASTALNSKVCVFTAPSFVSIEKEISYRRFPRTFKEGPAMEDGGTGIPKGFYS